MHPHFRLRSIIVADEPTGELDAETTEQILLLLHRLNKELGMTFLMVTHDPRAAAIAGRQLRPDKGRLVDPGEPCCGMVGRLMPQRGHAGRDGAGGVVVCRATRVSRTPVWRRPCNCR